MTTTTTVRAFVVKGPAVVGNLFGYFGKRVPEGSFAVCAEGEYANGGRGPCQVEKGLFATRDAAETAAEALGEFEYE